MTSPEKREIAQKKLAQARVFAERLLDGERLDRSAAMPGVWPEMIRAATELALDRLRQMRNEGATDDEIEAARAEAHGRVRSVFCKTQGELEREAERAVSVAAA